MKLPVKSLLALRKASTAVSAVETSSISPAVLNSEFFDHIRQQVYGDAKKVDKIVVHVQKEGEGESKPILVNRNVSTAFHCFNHINKQLADDAVLAEVSPDVGGSYVGSVNQPLQDKSTIRLLSFNTADAVSTVNDAYWRSCSFTTAAILQEALSTDIEFDFPKDSLKNSFFSVTVKGLEGSVLSADELSTINRFGKTFIRQEKPFEVIDVPKSIADENGITGTTLLRVGRHVFQTDGPVIRSTAQIGRFSIFRSRPTGHGNLLVGGVSLPHQLNTSSYSWGLIAKNAIQKFSSQPTV